MRHLHVILMLLCGSTVLAGPSEDLQQQLNELGEIQGDDALESWRELGEAVIAMEAMPDSIAGASMRDIHPGHPGWADALAWAQAHEGLQDTIKIVGERKFVGLPYGLDAVPDEFAAAGFSVSLPDLETSISPSFNWLGHLENITTWAKVEAWRRFAEGDPDGGVDLMLDSISMLRKRPLVASLRRSRRPSR